MDDDIELTEGQDSALNVFTNFLMDPEAKVMRLSGYAGTGKSTLIRILLKRLDGYIKMWKLLMGETPDLEVALTATTNKAAEALSDLTGKTVKTIHSFLGLRPVKDENGQMKLIPAKGSQIKIGYLLFIDEASMIDPPTLTLIFERTDDCKIVFMGDKAQLLPVKWSFAPVFEAPFLEAGLTEVVRQAAGSPINALATQFRETVATGIWTPFEPDGDAVVHLDREAFDQAVLAEFNRPDWKYNDSKVLSFTNHRAIHYNAALREHISGDPELQVGDYVIVNSYLRVGEHSFKTDSMVRITDIGEPHEYHGVRGRKVELNNTVSVFTPYNPRDIRPMADYAAKSKNWKMQRDIEAWADLRAAYAQTVNKSQGSTYDKVFIDIDDIATCTSGNNIARLMYVAVSRARYKVYLTGDFG